MEFDNKEILYKPGSLWIRGLIWAIVGSFSFGFVYACLVGMEHRLGHAKFSDLSEMWHGEYMKNLRKNHLEVGATCTKGCEDCGMQWKASKDKLKYNLK